LGNDRKSRAVGKIMMKREEVEREKERRAEN